jgi:hypothetical protein
MLRSALIRSSPLLSTTRALVPRSFGSSPSSSGHGDGHGDGHGHGHGQGDGYLGNGTPTRPPRPLPPKTFFGRLISLADGEDTAHPKSIFGTYWQKMAVIFIVAIGAAIVHRPVRSPAERYAIYKLYFIDGYRLPNLSPPPSDEEIRGEQLE